VAALDADEQTLAVETRTGIQISVSASDDTRIRVPGIEKAEFSAIAVGDRVAAVGRFDPQDPSSFLARGLGVLAAPDIPGD
jgi:hypothetical protein